MQAKNETISSAISPTVKSEVVSALCELLNNGDEADRCYASRALGKLGDTVAIPDLIKCLHDEDIDVCIDAAEALGKMRATAAITELIETADKDSDGEVRTSAVAALGMIGNALNGNGIDNSIDNNRLIDTLTRIAGSRPDDINYTEDGWDPWWDMQLKAVTALGQMRAESAADTIAQLLDDENGQDIESELLKSLAFMGDSGEEILIKRLKKGAPRERRRVIRALGFRSTTRTLHMLKLAIEEPDADVRSTALEALVTFGSAEQLPDMIKLFHDENEGVRQTATKTVAQLSAKLGRSKLSSSAPLAADNFTTVLVNELTILLNDTDPAVRATVLDILTDSAVKLNEDQTEMVHNAMTDKNADVAAAACRLTGKCNNIKAKQDLLTFVEDIKLPVSIRSAATLALGNLKHWDANIANTLTHACVDQQQPVRLAALNALLELDSASKKTSSKNTTLKNTKSETDDANLNEQCHMDVAVTNQRMEQKLPTAIDSILLIYKGGILPAVETESDGNKSKLAEHEDSVTTETANETINVETGNVQDASPAAESDIATEVSVNKEVISTIDGITKTNVKMTLTRQTHEKTTADEDLDIADDEALKPYLDLVKENNQVGSWLKTRDVHASILDDARRLATRILGKSDQPQIVELLIEALNDNDELIRKDAADSLAEIYNRNPQMNNLNDAIDALAQMLDSSNREERIVGLRSIATMAPAMNHYIEDKKIIPKIVALLDDEDSAVCIQAIASLANIVKQPSQHTATEDNSNGNPVVVETVECFAQLLNNSDPGIRTVAATSLIPLINILHNSENQSLAATLVIKIANAGFDNNGDQARVLGKALKNTMVDIASSVLLSKLAELDTSRERRFAIEMLEEIFKTDGNYST